MAFSQNSGRDHLTLKSSINLSSAQYRFIKQSGSLAVIGSTGAFAHGILQNAPQSNEIAVVDAGMGPRKVVSGGSINQSAFIESDNSGRAVAVTLIQTSVTGAEMTMAFALGVALEKVTTSGQTLSINFAPMYIAK